MKLITFDVKNSSSKRENKSYIKFNANGVIYISKAAAEKIGISAGNQLYIAQDEDSPNDWYLVVGKDGFMVRTNKGGVMEFSSVHICRSIISAFDIKSKSVSFDLATEKADNDQFEMYAILTDTAKYKEIEE